MRAKHGQNRTGAGIAASPHMRAAIVVLIILATESVALACACCDRGSTREIVGWSSTGRSALVRYETQACEQHVALEVWRAGRDAPAACFDLLAADPDAQVACSAITDGMHELAARTSRRTRLYPRAPLQLHPGDVRARVWRARPTEDEESYVSPLEMRLEIRVAGAWVEVWSGRFYAGRPESYDIPTAFQYVEQPLEVAVWPTPNGDRALLTIRGHDTAPGMGEWPTSMHWISLPEGSSTRRVAATSEPTLSTMEHRAGFPRRVRAARTIVDLARQAVDEEHLSEAEYLYALALYANPRLSDAILGLSATRLARGRGDGLDLLLRAVAIDPEAVLRTESDPRFAVLGAVPAYWVVLDAAATLAVRAR